jgi:hypothetical protein
MTGISKLLSFLLLAAVFELLLAAITSPAATAQLQYIPPTPKPVTPVPTPAAVMQSAAALPAPTLTPLILAAASATPMPATTAADLQPERSVLTAPGRARAQGLDPRGRTRAACAPLRLQTVHFAGLTVRMPESARTYLVSEGVLRLQDGEICLETTNPTTILVGTHKINLSGHSLTLINRQADCLTVRNLFDDKYGTVRVTSANHSLTLQIGQEAVINFQRGNDLVPNYDDSIGRRRTTRLDLPDGESLTASEISLVSLLKDNPVMSALRKSPKAQDRELIERTLKSAVIVDLSTASHGQYYIISRRPNSAEICSIVGSN